MNKIHRVMPSRSKLQSDKEMHRGRPGTKFEQGLQHVCSGAMQEMSLQPASVNFKVSSEQGHCFSIPVPMYKES